MSSSLTRQIPLNIATNLAVFIVGVCISIYMTPFYIKHFGVEGLGVIRLAFLLPMYTGLVSLVITGAVGRFLTIDLQKNAYREANQTFNTAFFSISALLVILIPLILMRSSPVHIVVLCKLIRNGLLDN